MKKIIAFAVVLAATGNQLHASQPEWAQVPEILSRIVAPVFPAREVVVTEFGAVGDGKTVGPLVTPVAADAAAAFEVVRLVALQTAGPASLGAAAGHRQQGQDDHQNGSTKDQFSPRKNMPTAVSAHTAMKTARAAALTGW